MYLTWFFFFAGRIQRDVTYLGHFVKCLIFLPGFNKTGIFCVYF